MVKVDGTAAVGGGEAMTDTAVEKMERDRTGWKLVRKRNNNQPPGVEILVVSPPLHWSLQ